MEGEGEGHMSLAPQPTWGSVSSRATSPDAPASLHRVCNEPPRMENKRPRQARDCSRVGAEKGVWDLRSLFPLIITPPPLPHNPPTTVTTTTTTVTVPAHHSSHPEPRGRRHPCHRPARAAAPPRRLARPGRRRKRPRTRKRPWRSPAPT